MADARFGAWYTRAGGGVEGWLLQLERRSTGDLADDVIRGDDARDVVNSGGGNDTIRGAGNGDALHGNGGNDTFEVAGGEATGDLIDGAAGSDRVLALASVDLRGATFEAIEEIEFLDDPAAGASTVALFASAFGAGLASNLLVDGNFNAVPDTLRIFMGSATTLTLAGLAFTDFDTAAAEGDRLLVHGDGTAEAIRGSSVADVISGRGGNDTLSGGRGVDRLLGGLGDDILVVNAAREAVEAAGEGVDTVRATVSYTLGANLEHLALQGSANLDGTGNGLANSLRGNLSANTLTGGAGNDTLTGAAGGDVLRGGAATDRMAGGAGLDIFDFDSARESRVGAARDVITDFVGNGAAAGDRIDLSTIDADTARAGNQAFIFIGAAAFTAAGQLRYAGGILSGNLDADAAAEFEIALTGAPALVAADLVL